eukprot:c29493_g1_i1 orf=171-830(+)
MKMACAAAAATSFLPPPVSVFIAGRGFPTFSSPPTLTGSPIHLTLTRNGRHGIIIPTSRPRFLRPRIIDTLLPASLHFLALNVGATSSLISATFLGGSIAAANSLDAVLPVSTGFLLAEIDSGTAKLIIAVLGPILAFFTLLFVVRIVMSWYPQLPVDKFPYVIAYVPTEPVLASTRRLIPAVGGVDISPVVWVAIVSFLNEALLGQQGLLVLLSQKKL